MATGRRQTLEDCGLFEGAGKSGAGMGRIFVPDERDKDYPMRAVIEEKDRPEDDHKYWWDQGWRGNQGRTPQCVAYSCLHMVEDGGVTHFYENRDHDPEYMNEDDESKHQPILSPESLYKQAQRLDQWPGIDYAGTSVRAGMKVLKQNGLIDEYRWAETFDDLVEAVLRHGPVVMGTIWYEGMFYPDYDNYIRAMGARVGGHAYVLNGVHIDEKKFRLKNSWGDEWGDNGSVWIRFEDVRKVFVDAPYGEACIANETRNPELFEDE